MIPTWHRFKVVVFSYPRANDVIYLPTIRDVTIFLLLRLLFLQLTTPPPEVPGAARRGANPTL